MNTELSLTISNAAEWLRNESLRLPHEGPVISVAPKIAELPPVRGAGLSILYNHLLRITLYLWVHSHQRGSALSSFDLIRATVLRSIQAISEFPQVSYFRPQHDLFLSQLVVLVRDSEIINAAAPLLITAESKDQQYAPHRA